MATTRDDLIREVLEELSALDATRVPEDEDADRVSDRIDTTLADLAVRNVIYIADGDSIEAAAFNPLVAYLVEICAPKFGRARDLAAMGEAERRLATQQRIGQGSGRMLRVDRALRRGRGGR